MVKLRDLVEITHPEIEWPVYFGFRDNAERYVEDRKKHEGHHVDATLYAIETVPTCPCCGWWNGAKGLKVMEPEPGHARCERHLGRNPCIIDGCGRTFDNKGCYVTEYVCGTHYRLAPLALRKSIKRIEKLAKRYGWKLVLRRRHHQLFERAIEKIKGALAGDIDMDEINKIMGWD